MNVQNENLYTLNPRVIWRAFASESFAFWMACAYLFFEYIRPQAIWSAFNIYPYWGRTFILLSLIGWMISTHRRLIWTKITTGIITLQVVIVLSSFNAYWPDVSWHHFMIFFNWVVIFFVLTQVITNKTRLYIFLLIFFLASFKLSFHGARTLTLRGFAFADWGLSGPAGFFQNPGELAIQMLIFAPLSFYFVRGIKSYIPKSLEYILYLMPITAIITIIGTNTRGSQLALAVQFIALILTTKHKIKTFVGVSILLYIFFSLLPEEQKIRFETLGHDHTSIQRKLYWQHGWQMIKDHPILGVGYFNFIPYYNKFHAEDIIIPHHTSAELPHNIFIQVGTDSGFTGLLIFLLLICLAFKYTCSASNSFSTTNSHDQLYRCLPRGMNLSLLGLLVAGQFVTVTYYPFFWIHLVLVNAIYLLSHSDQS
jgi:putative inorganic carbon (hco3(-)) transporter